MTDAPEVTPFAVPDRPDPDDIIASVWGRWVQDQLVGPTRAALWRNTAQALAVDGANPVVYDTKDDPRGLAVTASSLKMPAAGIVIVSACSAMTLGGAAAPSQLYLSLLLNGAEVRRGNQLQSPTAGMPPSFTSTLSGIVPVALNDTFTTSVYAQATGVTKSLFAGRAFQYLEVCYLTAY